jgi:hypothetical protein
MAAFSSVGSVTRMPRAPQSSAKAATLGLWSEVCQTSQDPPVRERHEFRRALTEAANHVSWWAFRDQLRRRKPSSKNAAPAATMSAESAAS